MTNREQLPNPNDNIAEILGFDPVSGERVEDRSGLAEIKYSGLAIPPEIQADFIQYSEVGLQKYDQQEYPLIKVYPERLLTVEKAVVADFHNLGTPTIRRIYHAWEQREDVNHFLWAARVDFEIISNKFRFYNLTHHGERSYPSWGDTISLTFFDNGVIHFGQHITCLEATRNARTYWLTFDENSLLGQMGFDTYNDIGNTNPSRLGAHLWLHRGKFKRLLKMGSQQISWLHGFFDIQIEKKRIIFKRSEDGNPKDRLEISRAVNRAEIIQKLFDPVTLEDPINSPPESDDSWRFANLMDVVGVKWERY